MVGWTLRSVDEDTPHAFRLRIDPASSHDAAAALGGRLENELAFEITDGDDDAFIDVRSTFSTRTAAVMRPLNALARAGVAATGLEFTDVVPETRRRRLRAVASGWRSTANQGPWRRRAEALGGKATVEGLVRLMDAARDSSERRAAAFVLGCAVFNTPGSESLTLHRASTTTDDFVAASLIGSVADRAQLHRLAGEPFSVAESDLISLIGRPDYTGERAAALLSGVPGPHSPELRSVLLDAARTHEGEHGAVAIGALANVEPDLELRAALEELLASGDTPRRAAALETAAAHWGVEMRPTWTEFLAGRSAPLRQSAESVLGRFGNSDDLHQATAHLAKLIRRRPGAVSWSPPRESALIELLLRHQDHEAARSGLDDISARWDRLDDDLREWLDKTHPQLHPAARATTPTGLTELDAEPEPPLRWPLPTIEHREDGTLFLWFEQTDMFTTRERFEELAVAEPGVTMVDGDREWVTLTVDRGADPEAVVASLWERAGGLAER